MPPSVFIDKVQGSNVAAVVSFAPPALTKPGDSIIAVVLVDPAAALFDATGVNTTFELLASYAGASATAIIARHIASADDGPTVSLTLTATPTWMLAVALVYRGLDPVAAVVGGSFANVAASTNFVCPSIVLAAFSDVYIGIAGVSSAATAVTPPADGTERFDVGAAGHQLEVFDVRPEAPGATGTKTATVGANQSGIAASVALRAEPLRAVGKSIRLIPMGTIGLPDVGV